MCSNNHTLRGDHSIVAGCHIIVKNTCNKVHEIDDIIGGARKKDATDHHVTFSGTKLIRRDEPMFRRSFHQLRGPAQIMQNPIFKAAHTS